jgi:hypothetical protein
VAMPWLCTTWTEMFLGSMLLSVSFDSCRASPGSVLSLLHPSWDSLPIISDSFLISQVKFQANSMLLCHVPRSLPLTGSMWTLLCGTEGQADLVYLIEYSLLSNLPGQSFTNGGGMERHHVLSLSAW